MTYCINSECPFRDCEKHLSKSRSKGKIYVANFDGICKRYITWMLKEIAANLNVENMNFAEDAKRQVIDEKMVLIKAGEQE